MQNRYLRVGRLICVKLGVQSESTPFLKHLNSQTICYRRTFVIQHKWRYSGDFWRNLKFYSLGTVLLQLTNLNMATSLLRPYPTWGRRKDNLVSHLKLSNQIQGNRKIRHENYSRKTIRVLPILSDVKKLMNSRYRIPGFNICPCS